MHVKDTKAEAKENRKKTSFSTERIGRERIDAFRFQLGSTYAAQSKLLDFSLQFHLDRR